jgi:hypothetical protein
MNGLALKKGRAMAYTPEFSQKEAAVVRRIAWAMGLPMTKTLSAIVGLAVKCSDHGFLCKSCKDKDFCDECPFKKEQRKLMQCTTNDTCPYCGKLIEDIEEYFSDQSDPKFECPKCGQTIQGAEVITYELFQGEG